MASKPFFSIITCTYNIGKHLQANLDSLAAQTSQDFEHIFVDGFSKDDTVPIITKYQKQHPAQVHLTQLPPHGIWNAINQANSLAKGQYILHLEGDNFLHDAQVLQDVHDFLMANPGADWIYSKINTIVGHHQSIGTFPNHPIMHHRWPFLLKFFNYIPQEAMFIKPQVFRKFGDFDEKLSTCSDYDYWLRIAAKTKWLFYDRVVTDYLIRADAISSDPKIKEENVKNCLVVQQKHLSGLEYELAKLINIMIESRNKIYQNAT